MSTGNGSTAISCLNNGTAALADHPYNIYGSDLSINSTNSTGSAPTYASTDYYTSEPMGLSTSGQIIASGSSTLTDMPSALTNTTVVSDFSFGQESLTTGAFTENPIQTEGESFTCSLYDNQTLIGTATASTTVQNNDGNPMTESTCEAVYPAVAAPNSYTAAITLPSGAYNAGDTYTFVISH